GLMMANFSSALNLTRLDNKKHSLQNSLEIFVISSVYFVGSVSLTKYLFSLYILLLTYYLQVDHLYPTGR
ncbi:hypothetical protein, partial [Desemzia sp. FAM 23991]|uniref:hypothetical protein n=1 Tax=unclassified Desemzia TaxID=2685243 RepID=UPI00388A13B0